MRRQAPIRDNVSWSFETKIDVLLDGDSRPAKSTNLKTYPVAHSANPGKASRV